MKTRRFYSWKTSIIEISFLYFVLSVFKEIILKPKVNKAFLLWFYGFIILAFKFRYDPFQLKFWIHYEVRFTVYFFVCGYQIIPLSVLKRLWFLIELPWHLCQKSIHHVFGGLPDSILLHRFFFFFAKISSNTIES